MSSLSISDFTKQMKVNKTIRSEIVPRPETAKNLFALNLLKEDKVLYEKRSIVNEIINDMVDYLIHERFCNVYLDFSPLFHAMDVYHKQKSIQPKDDEALKKLEAAQKELEKVQKQCRIDIMEKLASKTEQQELAACSMVTKILPGFVEKYSEYTGEEKVEKLKTLELYQGMNTLFQPTCKTFESLFSTEKNANGIASRIVDVNAEIFRNNYIKLQLILQDAPEAIKAAEENSELTKRLDGWTISQSLNPECYYRYMTQKGITGYNELIGQVNEQVNLFCQEYGKAGSYVKYKLATLQKQIRSKVKSSFELPEKFEADKDVYAAVNKFLDSIKNHQVLERLAKIPDQLSSYNLGKIYLSKYAHGDVSNYISSEWRYLYDSCWAYFDCLVSPKVKSKREDKIRAAYKNTPLSIQQLNSISSQFGISKKPAAPIQSYIGKIKGLVKNCSTVSLKMNPGINLIETQEKITELKNCLDPYLDVLHWMKDFMDPRAEDTDELFYGELYDLLADMEEITPLYNKVRNYVTRKPYSLDKYSVHLGAVSLGAGWDKNKMQTNCQALIKCGEDIIFAVWNTDKNAKKEVAAVLGSATDLPEDKGSCRLMILKQITNPKRDLPHMIFNKNCQTNKQYETYPIPDHILDVYNTKKYKAVIGKDGNPDYDPQCLWDLIDFYKNILLTCQKFTEYYHFEFLPTKEYETLDAFYDDVNRQSLHITWKYLPEAEISRLEKEGKLFLFTLYNKDFSDYSTGNASLHTMYLKQVFSESESKNPSIVLNGGVQLFYREASIKDPFTHKKGTLLVNKTYEVLTEDGAKMVPIPDRIYCELKDFLSGKSNWISPEAKPYLDKVKTHTASHDIVKNKRYTTGKFFIHTPIAINPFAEKSYRFNEKVHRFISENDVNVLGIIRGERNLLYVCIIDSQGNILEQRSLNVVGGYDYKTKLLQRERERTEAQKDWKEEDKIKDLKKGYLSFAIHEVCSLVLKYHAVVVMEDLNYSFKEKRVKIERNVYQQFETALYNKLNYLVSKDVDPQEAGGLLNGYQLAYIPDSLKQAGKQCGFIFFVPRNYTASIDPATGFANLFYLGALKNKTLTGEFFQKFHSIAYEKNMDMFCFRFDYRDFADMKQGVINPQSLGAKTRWSVYTNGMRLRATYNNNILIGTEEVNLTSQLASLFIEYGIHYEDGHNLLDDMDTITRNEANFFERLKKLFSLTLQMRNFRTEDEAFYDHMISPVMDENGRFFNTAVYQGGVNNELPKDGGATAAYCIALKGLMNMQKIKGLTADGKKVKSSDLMILNAEYFDFLSSNNFC